MGVVPANGFSESRCTEETMFDFEFVNKLEPKGSWPSTATLKQAAKAEDSTRSYLGGCMKTATLVWRDAQTIFLWLLFQRTT